MKLLIVIVLTLMLLPLSVASQWFVYGLWPQNWAALILFWLIGLTIGAALKLTELLK